MSSSAIGLISGQEALVQRGAGPPFQRGLESKEEALAARTAVAAHRRIIGPKHGSVVRKADSTHPGEVERAAVIQDMETT